MRRARAMWVAGVLALAGCGGGDADAPSTAATTTPVASATPTSTPTPVATSTPDAEPTPKPGKCDQVSYKAVDRGGTVHPAANFFAPGAENIPTPEVLDHLLVVDNAVVVIYAANTPEKTRDRLERWWAEDVTERTPVVVPDESPGALGVRARIASRELRCNGIDFKRLTAFANRTDIGPSTGNHG